jgi:hypothetical protein
MGMYNIIKCSLTGNCHIPLSELYRGKKKAGLAESFKEKCFTISDTYKMLEVKVVVVFQTPAGTSGYPSSLPVIEVMLLYLILWLRYSPATPQ